MSSWVLVSRDAAEVRPDLPAVHVLPSVAALLAEPAINPVVVCSPDAPHAEHALIALQAGKHVLVDKPFATTSADARRVADEAETRGRLLTIFHNRCWDADFLTLRRLISEDTLCDIVQFESHSDRWRPVPVASWKEAREGGSWLDLDPHLVDQALRLFGGLTGIGADIATLRRNTPASGHFHIVLRYPRLRVLLHSSKLVVEHGLRFAVHGTRVRPDQARCHDARGNDLGGQVGGQRLGT